MHQLGGDREVPVGVAHVRMAEVGRQTGQTALDVDAAAVPAEQRPDSKSMAQVMQTGTAGIGRAAQADLPGQLDEGPAQRPLGDPGAVFGEEEARAARIETEAITLRRVVAQRPACRLVNGNVSRLPELAAPYGQNAVCEVDVVAVQA